MVLYWSNIGIHLKNPLIWCQFYRKMSASRLSGWSGPSKPLTTTLLTVFPFLSPALKSLGNERAEEMPGIWKGTGERRGEEGRAGECAMFNSLVQKSSFSQSLKEKCIWEVVRIGSIWVKLWKAKFLVLYDVIFLARLQGKFEIDHSVKGLITRRSK